MNESVAPSSMAKRPREPASDPVNPVLAPVPKQKTRRTGGASSSAHPQPPVPKAKTGAMAEITFPASPALIRSFDWPKHYVEQSKRLLMPEEWNPAHHQLFCEFAGAGVSATWGEGTKSCYAFPFRVLVGSR